jgi:antibiotic biosynthesis monooxygenase (ABM) superfamily enzyme
MQDFPQHETIFDSNELLHSYWEQSFNDRNTDYIQDILIDERNVSDEIAELERMSMDSFEPETKDIPQAKHVDLLVEYKSEGRTKKNVFVEPKSAATPPSATVLIVSVVLIALFYYFVLQPRKIVNVRY